MLTMPQPPQIHLPRGWQGCVKSAVLYAIALAHYSIVYVRAWAVDSINARVRLTAENNQLQEECALLREELEIKDSRITQIPPQRQPHYGPVERMAILELRTARGWSLKQTADTFLVTPATILSWVKRIDDQDTYSHPFVERLIGSIRRELLDHTFFWTATDLETKLHYYQGYYNEHRCHSSREGITPVESGKANVIDINWYRWEKHCRGLFQLPVAA